MVIIDLAQENRKGRRRRRRKGRGRRKVKRSERVGECAVDISQVSRDPQQSVQNENSNEKPRLNSNRHFEVLPHLNPRYNI